MKHIFSLPIATALLFMAGFAIAQAPQRPDMRPRFIGDPTVKGPDTRNQEASQLRTDAMDFLKKGDTAHAIQSLEKVSPQKFRAGTRHSCSDESVVKCTSPFFELVMYPLPCYSRLS